MIQKKRGFKSKLDIAKNWLPRYTGTTLDQFGDYMLLTNFHNYVDKFAEKFRCDIKGIGKPMQTATNSDGLTIINFGMGSANAATIMDLLMARKPKGVLFLGKCGGLKRSTEIGHFILPTAAIREKERPMIICQKKFLHFLLLSFINLSQKKLCKENLNTAPASSILPTGAYGNGMNVSKSI